MKLSVVVASVFLFIVSLTHLLRFIFGVELLLGFPGGRAAFEVPRATSLPAAAFTALLGAWLLADARRSR